MTSLARQPGRQELGARDGKKYKAAPLPAFDTSFPPSTVLVLYALAVYRFTCPRYCPSLQPCLLLYFSQLLA